MTRKTGSLNKLTIERLRKLRQLIANGFPDWEIKETMALTQREWIHLKARHYQTAQVGDNATYYARFQVGKTMQRQQALRIFDVAKGVEYPLYGKKDPTTGKLHVDPSTGKPYPRFQVKPAPAIQMQALRFLDDLDKTETDIGVKMGVFKSPPRRLIVEEGGVEDISDLSEVDLIALFGKLVGPESAKAIAAKVEELPEGVTEHDFNLEAAAAELLKEGRCLPAGPGRDATGKFLSKGNGHVGNGKEEVHKGNGKAVKTS